MRALLVVLALFASYPLFAGDLDRLAQSVKLFKSQEVAERDAGSRIAKQEIKRALAPLIEAMKDPDPEVRRRAREAILSFVPHHDRNEPNPANQLAQVMGNQIVIRFAAIQGLKAVQLNAAGGVKLKALKGFQVQRIPRIQVQGVLPLLRPLAVAKHTLAGLGITGRFVRRGFVVDVVTKQGQAAKAGIRKGDIILNVNGRAIRKLGDFAAAARKMGWKGATVQVRRGNQLVIHKIP